MLMLREHVGLALDRREVIGETQRANAVAGLRELNLETEGSGRINPAKGPRQHPIRKPGRHLRRKRQHQRPRRLRGGGVGCRRRSLATRAGRSLRGRHASRQGWLGCSIGPATSGSRRDGGRCLGRRSRCLRRSELCLLSLAPRGLPLVHRKAEQDAGNREQHWHQDSESGVLFLRHVRVGRIGG